jgi:hypothetical protein
MTTPIFETLNVQGTRTGRISSNDEHRANTPKPGQPESESPFAPPPASAA